MIDDTLIEKISSACSSITYIISGWLCIGHIMNYLNNNDGAFGVILGFMTFLGQMFFSYLKHKAYKQRLKLNKTGEKDD
jgi:hypothetical protein